jgi:hypothetical protein
MWFALFRERIIAILRLISACLDYYMRANVFVIKFAN